MRFLLSYVLIIVSAVSYCQTVPVSNFHLKAIELSENMSKLSSKNDEIIALIYAEYPEDSVNTYCKLYVEFEFVLDSARNEYDADIDELLSLSQPAPYFWVILLEKDTQQDVIQIEAVCRLYPNEIEEAYQKRP